MTKIRWGVLGAGRIAHTFCRDINFTNNAQLSAVASRDKQTAEQFSASYNINKAYGDYAALYGDPDVDAIYIATPHNCHYEQVKAALQHGKHVLCEKPFTVSPAQCIELSRLAKKQKCFLMEGMWSYFLPAIQTALRWVEQGRIGKLVQIKADFGYPLEYTPDRREYDVNLSGGCLFEMGIYPLALAQLFMQQAPDKITCKARFAPNGVEDDVVILAEYAQATVELATSFRARLPNWAYIVGDLGYIAIKDFFRADECQLYVLDDMIEYYTDGRKGSGFEYQIQSASDCISRGKLQSTIMPLSTTLSLQKQMATLFKHIEHSRLAS